MSQESDITVPSLARADAEEQLGISLIKILEDCRTMVIRNTLGRYPGSRDLVPIFGAYAVARLDEKADVELTTVQSYEQYTQRLEQIVADLLIEVKNLWPQAVQNAFDDAGMIGFGDSRSGYFEPGVLKRPHMNVIAKRLRLRMECCKALYGHRHVQGKVEYEQKVSPRAGRKANVAFNDEITKVLESFASNWRDRLEDVCEQLDSAKLDDKPLGLPSSKKWKQKGCKTWMDALDEDREGVVKALQYRLDWAQEIHFPVRIHSSNSIPRD